MTAARLERIQGFHFRLLGIPPRLCILTIGKLLFRTLQVDFGSFEVNRGFFCSTGLLCDGNGLTSIAHLLDGRRGSTANAKDEGREERGLQ